MEREIKQNIDLFNKVKNDSTFFEQPIQLQHVKSQKYISLRYNDRKKNEPQSDKNKHKIQHDSSQQGKGQFA